ncbi:hypothetical protein, partial [Nostoc sp. LPT]|uniref:hypothetical protein n=1 Tax=Nostoc sp. LPT TaxID=2815387 RepID=UPI001D3F79EA
YGQYTVEHLNSSLYYATPKILNSEYIVVFETSFFADMQGSYKIVRQKFVLFFQIQAFAPGIWTVQILVGNDELVRVPFEICKPC